MIGSLSPGEELVITEGERPVAKTSDGRGGPQPRRTAAQKGKLIILKEDDERLKDFALSRGGLLLDRTPSFWFLLRQRAI